MAINIKKGIYFGTVLSIDSIDILFKGFVACILAFMSWNRKLNILLSKYYGNSIFVHSHRAKGVISIVLVMIVLPLIYTAFVKIVITIGMLQVTLCARF